MFLFKNSFVRNGNTRLEGHVSSERRMRVHLGGAFFIQGNRFRFSNIHSCLFLADIQSPSPVKLASRFMHLLLFPPKCVALPHLNTPTNTLHNRSFPRSPIVLPDNVPLMQASRTVWEQVGEKKRERERIYFDRGPRTSRESIKNSYVLKRKWR